jgi:hypothetical protein
MKVDGIFGDGPMNRKILTVRLKARNQTFGDKCDQCGLSLDEIVCIRLEEFPETTIEYR